VKIQNEVLSAVTPRSVVVGYRRFGVPCCLHLHREVNPDKLDEKFNYFCAIYFKTIPGEEWVLQAVKK